MASISNLSFWQHLLIALGLFVVVVGYLVASNWDTFSVVFENAGAMNEGGATAQQLRSPDSLLTYIANNPERVSLVAYDVGAEEEGIFYYGDSLRAVSHAPKLQLLAEYARRVDEGTLDPERRVPLADVSAFALPNINESLHQSAFDSLRVLGQIQGETVALKHLARSVAQFNDDASADWLLLDLGAAAVDSIPARLGLRRSDAPVPQSGLYLNWIQGDTPEARIKAVRAMPDTARTAEAYPLAARLRRDSSFRHTWRERLAQEGTDLSIRQQRALAQATYPKGTAAEYASLLARLAQDSLLSAAASDMMQEDLERPIQVSDSVQVAFSSIVSKGGAFPGILSFAGYVRRTGDQPPRVVVMLMDEMPIAVFYHLLQTGIDKGFHIQLLGDDAFFERVRTTLQEAKQTPSPPAS